MQNALKRLTSIILLISATSIAFLYTAQATSSQIYTSNHSAVVAVNPNDRIVAAQQADSFTCLANIDQTPYCVGYNIYGQLGNGTTSNSQKLVEFALPLGEQAIDITVSNKLFSCATTDSQATYCAGYNNVGQLGDGSTTTRSIPVKFNTPAGELVEKTAVSFYSDATCVLTISKAVYCSGLNQYGRLGNGNTTNQTTPVKFNLPASELVESLEVGIYNSCVVTDKQKVYCAGLNHVGQLSRGTATLDEATPLEFQLPIGKKAASVQVGFYHICVLTIDQMVYCSGFNAYGQLGDGTTTSRTTAVPFGLAGGTLTQTIAADTYQTCALSAAQELYCAGYNLYGQLGIGTFADSPTPQKFILPGTKKVYAISPSYFTHNCVVATDFTVYCAGYNVYGGLGDGSTTNRGTPVLFQMPPSELAERLTLSSYQTCVITQDKSSYCSGLNNFAQLGNEEILTTQSTPVMFLLP